MKFLRSGIGVTLALLFILLACSKDNNPITPELPDNPVVLDTGGLAQIPGNATDTVFQVMPGIPSHPAPQDKMDDDGFMRTRLDAKLHPEATIEQLNAALASEQAVVTFANPGRLAMVLRIPEVSDRAGAESVAARLMTTGAFLAVFPGYAVGIDGVAVAPGTDADTYEHLTSIKMPAAWNVRGLAERRAERVSVLVADDFVSGTPHSDIPAQRFLHTTTGTYLSSPDGQGFIPGNHGVHVSGTLAASLDADQGTGAHPGNTTLIDLQCLAIGGQLFPEVIDNIWNHFPATDRFILNTSLGQNKLISQKSKLQRAYEAIDWRVAAALHQDRFLHCTAAGNQGQATDDSRYSHWNSPFTMAAYFATPQEMAPVGEHTVLEVANLLHYATQMYMIVPEAQNKLTNVIIVGNSEFGGAKDPTSCTPADVRAVGVEVYNVCAKADATTKVNDCSIVDGRLRAKYTGTSMATPQIAGLAAYMWNLKPELTVSEIMSEILTNFRENDPITPGRVDAYLCVTSLDRNLTDCPVRKELLDVAGNGPTPGSNGAFDENDLQVYFDQFRAIQTARDNQTGPFYDNSRYDLNGNGISTIDSLQIDYDAQRFDLDVNSPAYYGPEVVQTIEGQEVKYDETEVSDLDILCYYAYSPLYTGSVSRRTELCIPCLGTFALQLNIASTLAVNQPESLTIKLLRRSPIGVETDAQGIAINVEVQNGSASPDQGVTGSDGVFYTDITADGTAPNVGIHVEAIQNGVLLDSLTISPSVISNASVRILEHTMTYTYSHWVLQWDQTTPSADWFTCDSVLDSSTVTLPTVGANQDDFVSQTGPCLSDDGATCQVRLDTRHLLQIDQGAENSTLEYQFTSTANHSALANDVMDDQSGTASAAKQVEILFEVTGARMLMQLQFGVVVREYFPIYDPVANGNSVAYGKFDLSMTNEDDGVTPQFGAGGWFWSQLGTQSRSGTYALWPGKYRCVLKIEDLVQLSNMKNAIPHVTEAKNDTDAWVVMRFTPIGVNGL